MLGSGEWGVNATLVVRMRLQLSRISASTGLRVSIAQGVMKAPTKGPKAALGTKGGPKCKVEAGQLHVGVAGVFPGLHSEEEQRKKSGL